MRSNNIYIVFDFETTSKFPNSCQPTQIAGAAVDGRTLKIIGDFDSYINISEDIEYMKKYNLDPATDEVLTKTHIKIEDLRKAPPPKVVWTNFTNWVNTFNYKQTKWTAPIRVGLNIFNYDDVITDRLCGKEPYGFGPWDNEYKKQALFNPIFGVDLLQIVYYWFNGVNEPESLSMDSLRKYFGMDTSKAHDAKFDVAQTAELLIKFLRLTRHYHPKIKFAGSFGINNEQLNRE